MTNAQNQPKVESPDVIPTPEAQNPEVQAQPSFLDRMANFENDPDIFKKLDQELNPNPQPPEEFKMTFFEKLIQPFSPGFWDRYAAKLEEHTRQEDAYAELVAETNRKKEQLLSELSKAQEQSTVQVEKAATRLGETPPDIAPEQQTIKHEALDAQQELDAEVDEIMANIKAQAESLQQAIDANEEKEQAPKKTKKKKSATSKATKPAETPANEEPVVAEKEQAPTPLNFEDFKKLMNKSLTPGKWVKIGENAYALDKNGRIRVKPANQEGIPGSYISKNRGGINELAELENKFIVAQILSKQINPGEWIKHGKHEYTTDKSGKLRVKNAGITGIPGSYLTKQDLNLLQKELGVNIAPQSELSQSETPSVAEEVQEKSKKRKKTVRTKTSSQTTPTPVSPEISDNANNESGNRALEEPTSTSPEQPIETPPTENVPSNENLRKELQIILDGDMSYIRTLGKNLKNTKYETEALDTIYSAEINYQAFQKLPELGYSKEEINSKQKALLENINRLRKVIGELSSRLMDDAVRRVESQVPKTQGPTPETPSPPTQSTAPEISPTPESNKEKDPSFEQISAFIDKANARFSSAFELDKQALIEKGKLEISNLLEFTHSLMKKIDPSGTSNFVDPGLWEEWKKIMKQVSGYEIIYPKAGEPVSLKTSEILKVDRDSSAPSRHVTQVTSFGFMKDGKAARRAQVAMAQ